VIIDTDDPCDAEIEHLWLARLIDQHVGGLQIAMNHRLLVRRIVPPSQAYVTRPPRTVVPSLPYGHRSYQWRGSNYYYGGGHWYRPYRNSYVIVGAPFGLFVPYLPSYYSTVWVGGTRYYYADGSYYTYANDRRGYIVSRSPYGDDPADDYDDYDSDDRGSSSTTDQDLYIYPMRGQSEQHREHGHRDGGNGGLVKPLLHADLDARAAGLRGDFDRERRGQSREVA